MFFCDLSAGYKNSMDSFYSSHSFLFMMMQSMNRVKGKRHYGILDNVTARYGVFFF